MNLNKMTQNPTKSLSMLFRFFSPGSDPAPFPHGQLPEHGASAKASAACNMSPIFLGLTEEEAPDPFLRPAEPKSCFKARFQSLFQSLQKPSKAFSLIAP